MSNRNTDTNTNTVEVEEEEEEESVIDLINHTGGDSSSAHADPMAPPSPPPPPTPAIVMSSRDPDAIFSGGGISFLTRNRNGSFNYGYSTFKGKRASLEDFYETRISEADGQMVAFFGVFDGHGGSRTAEYLKNNLFKNLSGHPDFINDPQTAIVEVFEQTDADYLNEEKGQQKDAGLTATTALLLGDRLLVANVGDSRVVACRAGSAIPLSIDHKPERPDERQWIEQAGGFIIWAATKRMQCSVPTPKRLNSLYVCSGAAGLADQRKFDRCTSLPITNKVVDLRKPSSMRERERPCRVMSGWVNWKIN